MIREFSLEPVEPFHPRSTGPATPDAVAAIPLKIGKYEIRSELGRGGFGRVYLAFDPLMSRQVAVKVLTSDPDVDLLTQFQAEAKTTGKLRHKNIVTVYEFGEHAGIPFLAMELLEGQCLSDFIRDKTEMNLLGKLRVVTEAAEGLRYAHEQGVIHRDVKPGNIMLLPSGDVKIMDFGIARLVELGSTRRSRSGSLTGTALYMAPEQFRGESADVQTDIFSFGMVCYEFFSGEHPFPEESDSGILYRMATRRPKALHQKIPGFPEALSRAIERAMSQDREVRYQSIEDFALDTEPILTDLRRRKATEIMEEVDRAIASGSHEAARSLIKRVLELDPSNTPARHLRNQFQSDDLARVMQQRNDALIQEGSARMAAMQYGEAIESFETILRVDPNCTEARAGFEKAHALLKISRIRGRLLSQGKQEALAGNWRAALNHVTEALKVDPDNEQAKAFEQEAILRVALSESAELVRGEEFEAAENLLERLSPTLAAHPAALAELERIRAVRGQVLQDRKKREIEARLANIESHRVEGDFAGALALADEAHLEFGDGFFDFSERALQIREEQAAHKRSQIVQTACNEAQEFLDQDEHEEAIESIDTALQVYPREKTLLKLRESAGLQLAEHLRARAAEEAIRRTHELMESGAFVEALARTNSALAIVPGHLELSALAANIEVRLEEQAADADWASVRRKALETVESDAREALAVLLAAKDKHGARSDYAAVFEIIKPKSDLAEAVSAVHQAIERKDWRVAGSKVEAAAQLGLKIDDYEALVSTIATGRQAGKKRALLARTRLGEEAVCPKCAASLSVTARFCDLCGAPVVTN